MDNEHKDLWEKIRDRASDISTSFVRVVVALIIMAFFAYAPAVVINLFYPRVELPFFHSALITLGISLLILALAWWEHTSKKKNE